MTTRRYIVDAMKGNLPIRSREIVATDVERQEKAETAMEGLPEGTRVEVWEKENDVLVLSFRL